MDKDELKRLDIKKDDHGIIARSHDVIASPHIIHGYSDEMHLISITF